MKRCTSGACRRRRTTKVCDGSAAVVLVALVAFALPGSARAYLNRGSFAIDVNNGGGGGRYFTGSPVDALTCNVCHAGGGATGINVSATPELFGVGYIPGQQYDIALRWTPRLDANGPRGAGSIEIIGSENQSIGQMSLVSEGDLQDEERCKDGADLTPNANAPAAIYTGEGRQVAGTQSCSASALRVIWQAPAEDQGPMWLYVATAMTPPVALVETPVPDEALAPTEPQVGVPDPIASYSSESARFVVAAQGKSASLAEVDNCSAAAENPLTTVGTFASVVLALFLRRRATLPTHH